eukprot:10956-Heterococcus_DN1.PRE.3
MPSSATERCYKNKCSAMYFNSTAVSCMTSFKCGVSAIGPTNENTPVFSELQVKHQSTIIPTVSTNG